jgi:hypothetical protein
MSVVNIVNISFLRAVRRVQRDAALGVVRDWDTATDGEGMRHIFVQDPLTHDWFEAYNEGRELCHA